MFQEFSKYAIQSPLMHMYLPIALNLISRENGGYTSLTCQILVVLYFDHSSDEVIIAAPGTLGNFC